MQENLIPGWAPTAETVKTANLTRIMQRKGFNDLPSFHRWTTEHYEDFWVLMSDELKIQFKTNPTKICDLSQGLTAPRWFAGASMNIVDSCFTAPKEATALIYQDNQQLKKMSYAELEKLVNRVANTLVEMNFKPGDAIGVAMPMDYRAVAIYLGIIKMGGVVVSIADSFSTQEMAVRLRITKAKAVFTQDVIRRGEKTLPLYEKVSQTGIEKILTCTADGSLPAFLSQNELFNSVACEPMSACNILFSSGTTGEPKAIPWNHTTPIKSASDAFFHQNIKAHDVLAWPTNLGWMMGPWLVFAALVNQASIALYTDLPKDRAFGEFITLAKVTMLGVVPTLVATWHQTRCMESLDWSSIKVFSSTGECSNPNDMLYLMSLAGSKPVIEYCGGTEIGGAYISSTVIENNYPSVFTTATMGNNFIIIDEDGEPADNGEVALLVPALGLSTTLLNNNHNKIYYEGMPALRDGNVLRRHGDQLHRLSNGYYTIQGRVDDTMNLGGIKVSSAEIERALSGLANITETAAIAVSPPNNGPSLLVIYAASNATLNKQETQKQMQQRINLQINPLFKIHDIVFVPDLPKTASNKIMRRVLRDKYQTRLANV